MYYLRGTKPRGAWVVRGLSAPQRCNAQRSDAQRKFFTTLSISLFLQRHRCDALPCFSASPVEIFYIAHIALRPLLPFFLSPQWFTVQNNKKFAKSYNAAMSPLATRDGQRNAQRTTQRCGALSQGEKTLTPKTTSRIRSLPRTRGRFTARKTASRIRTLARTCGHCTTGPHPVNFTLSQVSNDGSLCVSRPNRK